jgi:hypothetical protein
MYLKRSLLVLLIGLLFFVDFSADAYETDILVKGWNIRTGLGYIHTGPEMDKIWTDGFAWEMLTIGYSPWKNLGVETGFIMGLTGMNPDVKNTVSVIYKYSGESGTQESAGGGWGGVPCGLRLRAKVFQTPAVLGIGFGGLYGFEEESGINAEGYSPRWTQGWGYYGLVSLHFVRFSSGNPYGWGLQARYVGGEAEVTDFAHALDGYANPPPEGKRFLSEGRLVLTFDIYMDFRPR